MKELRVGNGAFKSYGSCVIESTPSLEVLAIGSSCFDNADSLVLNGFAKLKSVVIGDDSFAGFGMIEIASVPVLEELQIGASCFAAASFELKGGV